MQKRRIQLQTGRIQLQTGRIQLQKQRTQLQTGRIQLQSRRIQLQKPVLMNAFSYATGIRWESSFGDLCLNLTLLEEIET